MRLLPFRHTFGRQPMLAGLGSSSLIKADRACLDYLRLLAKTFNSDAFNSEMQPLVGGAVGVVYASANASFKKGDLVQGMLGWELFTLVPKGQGLRPLDPKGLPLSYFLVVLGMPGLTAYAGLFDIGAPKEGETVFVSAASGAVGQIVGQLAKLKGAHVVGSAGSAEKVS